MRGKAIVINWAFSFTGLCVDPDLSVWWGVTVGLGWFIVSSLLLQYARGRGWLNFINDKKQ